MNWSHASTIKQHAAALCNMEKTQDNLNRRDLLFFFNELYNNLYRKICRKDKGFYAKRERLDVLKRLSANPLDRVSGMNRTITLPDYVLEVVNVYEAQDEFDAGRVEYKNADNWSRGGGSARVYVLEGRSLFVDESFARMPVWVEFIPEPGVITWPTNNHYPDIIEDEADVPEQPHQDTIGYTRISPDLVFTDLRRGGGSVDMRAFYEDDEWAFQNWLVSDPYLIINYANKILPGKRQIRIYSRSAAGGNDKYSVWNAFDYKGRPTNCECLYAAHDDYSLGDIVVRDYNDGGKIKKLGFFPDTKVTYPNSITCDLLTYMLADRIARLCNIDNSPVIDQGLADSVMRFEGYTKVNRASFHQIEVVRPFNRWI